MSELAACTIIAKNYLAHARVLSRSFRQHNPEARMIVLFVDDIDGYVDPANEPFDLVRLEELPIDDLPTLCFKYSVLELATAVKPFLLQYIFDRYRTTKLLYLDPDILIFKSLTPLYDLLTDHSLVVIPHTTDPLPDDDCSPNELTFLRAGAYNLGFIGVAHTETSRRMLSWWQARCRNHCVSRQREGLFVDQKWVDLVPGMFGDTSILRDPSYNVAYWNLNARQIGLEPEFTVNGQPLRFFHFSGYDPETPDVVSKHQTRFSMKDVGEAQNLFSLYRERLLAEGYHECARWQYSHSRFDNGPAISPMIRDLYYRLGAEASQFGNPFSTKRPHSFFEWLNAPTTGETSAKPYLSNLIAHFHNYREDLAKLYPRYRDVDRDTFLQWLRLAGGEELGLDPVFLAPIREDGMKPQIGERVIYTHTAMELFRSLFDGSCRVCILIPLGVRWGARARLRGKLENAVRPATSTALRPATSTAAVSVPPRAPKARLRQRIVASLIRRTLRPCPKHLNLSRWVGDGSASARRVTQTATRKLGDARTVGVNLVGYLTTESGVGEAARLMIRALDAAKLPRVLINFEQSYSLRRADRTFTQFSEDNPHGVNLIHINADQVDVFAASRARFFEGKYNIGFWMWELPDFPSEWSGSFRYFDEIWAASAFAAEAIARAAPIPTVKVPVPILEYRGRRLGRDYFGLQPDKFTFLFLFDFMSGFERKNPLAVVGAFKRAFENDDRAALVLKCVNASADPINAARLHAAAQHPSIRVIEDYMSREEVASLTHACDVYVSLHRSEGYGLTLAEAMMAARPVIATPYSGSADFTTVGNSLPVRYRLVEIQKDEGPYRRGSFWAEPDIDHAAELMRWAFDHKEATVRLGAQAKEHITQVLSPEAVGKLVRARLEVIARVKGFTDSPGALIV